MIYGDADLALPSLARLDERALCLLGVRPAPVPGDPAA
jgi:hypothetical protein